MRDYIFMIALIGCTLIVFSNYDSYKPCRYPLNVRVYEGVFPALFRCKFIYLLSVILCLLFMSLRAGWRCRSEARSEARNRHARYAVIRHIWKLSLCCCMFICLLTGIFCLLFMSSLRCCSAHYFRRRLKPVISVLATLFCFMVLIYHTYDLSTDLSVESCELKKNDCCFCHYWEPRWQLSFPLNAISFTA